MCTHFGERRSSSPAGGLRTSVNFAKSRSGSLTSDTCGFERYRKKTRREAFWKRWEKVVPWRELCALIRPLYRKPGNGRPPVGVERMLRMYFLQQWFNLLDPAVEEGPV
jgi:hypothetical protein